jgi:hypothetical protein
MVDVICLQDEMMFTTYEAILDQHGPLSACVQFRGKAQKTCKTDAIFVSAGIGTRLHPQSFPNLTLFYIQDATHSANYGTLILPMSSPPSVGYYLGSMDSSPK